MWWKLLATPVVFGKNCLALLCNKAQTTAQIRRFSTKFPTICTFFRKSIDTNAIKLYYI